MTTQVQLRRGNSAEISIATGANGELFYDVSLFQLVIQDGVTIGGHRVIQANVDAVFDAGVSLLMDSGFNIAANGDLTAPGTGTFVGNVTVDAALPLVDGDLTRKNYVDDADEAQDLIINDNANAIGVNTGNISTNAGLINGNTGDIGDNTDAIGVNATAIGVNAGNISDNTADIGTNTGDISDNADAIGVNATAIGVNAGNISGNTGNISTNTGNISTNTGNIGTNTGNITTLQGTAPTADQKAALVAGASPPNAGNPYATQADIGGFIPVVLIDSRGPGISDWTITGVTIGKPLYLIYRYTGDILSSSMNIRITSGTLNNDTGTGVNSASQLGSGNKSINLIPNATVVVIAVLGDLNGALIEAFQ